MRWIRTIRSRFSTAYARGDLHYVLSAASPQASLPAKIAWFDSLLEWIRLPASVDSDLKSKSDSIQSSRIKFMQQFLERNPELRTKVMRTLESILVESDPYPLLTDAGIEVEHSFTREFFDRLLDNVIPKVRDPKDLKATFELVFRTDEDVLWIQGMDLDQYQRISDFLCSSSTGRMTFAKRFFEAAVLALNSLNIRLCAIIESREVRQRLPNVSAKDSPFYNLQRIFAALVVSEEGRDVSDYVDVNVTEALGHIETVYPHLETSGVSIDLVYKLDTAKSILERIRELSGLLHNFRAGKMTPDQARALVVMLAKGTAERDSLTSFLGANFNLIARKIVERTSETGEHYITRDRKEYFEMLRSAGGGGAMTVLTTYFKSAISKAGMPLFFEGIFSGINYSLSFIFIQLAHFTLATKTPAMTASTLAAKLKHVETEQEIEEFVEEVVCLVRSAFAAVLGNLGMVVPGAILFDIGYYLVFGRHVFSPEYSIEQFKAHSPLLSLTFIYGAVTGFILWFSSILGGWVDNWFVYRKQFEVYESSSFFSTILGPNLHKSSAAFLRRNLSGFSTNIALGFLLAFSGVWGKFFGLPLQVRHVTLSAGTLAFAVQGLASVADSIWLILGGILGIVLIGVLNFGVSFSLSLFVAARARNIRLGQFPSLVGRILQRFRVRPRDFFFP